MKVALIGYGKMGRLVDQVAKERRIEVVARISSETEALTKEALNGADVCIDFTNADALLQNMKMLCALGTDIVIGTTGWESHLTAIKSLIEDAQIGAIYSPNFSIGMQVFFRLVREAAHLINRIEGYDTAGFEIHHRQKGDSPSGSAVGLTEVLTQEITEKKKPIYERLHREILPEELHFPSLRCGFFPGTHTVLFDSPADTIELIHRARSREGFAVGALLAAQWIHGKEGLYTIEDLIETYLH